MAAICDILIQIYFGMSQICAGVSQINADGYAIFEICVALSRKRSRIRINVKINFHTAICVFALPATKSLIRNSSAETGCFMKKRLIAGILAGMMMISLAASGNEGGESAEPTAAVMPTGEVSPTEEVKPTEPEPTKEAEPTKAEPTKEAEPTEAEPTKEAEPTEAEPTKEVVKPEDIPAIQSVFSEHNMKVGTCLTTQMIEKSMLAELIKKNFNSVTMENSMKPDYMLDKTASIEAGDLVVEFNTDIVKMLDWARENGMAVRGHTIIWHSQTPKWIFHENFDTNAPFVTREVMLARMESYIKQVFEKLDEYGYTDLFYAYDVVNEAWMEDGKIREEMNFWYQIIGEDYLWHAFNYANKYAPESIDLYYNDYNEQYKTDALLKFVDTLVDEEGNYLIDGIGLQAHLYTGDDLKTYLNTVEQLGATGLMIELTELDVSLGSWQNKLMDTDENLRAQGRYYYELVEGLFKLAEEGKVKMDALTFWGFADGLSWRKDASPLLYDTLYMPKYALYGALQIKEKAGYE